MHVETINPIKNLDKSLHNLEASLKKENKKKACLFNLVITLESDERFNYYQKVIQELIDQFPCRIFLIYFDPHQKEVSCSLKTYQPKSSSSLYCECINLRLDANSQDQIHSFLMAYFVTDLPIYYIPTEHNDRLMPFTKWISPYCKRVICDSFDVKDVKAFSKNLEKLAAENIDVADLNWSRIESWRETIAKNLNEKFLEQPTTLEICYNACKNQHPFQALFLSEFIKHRLKKNGAKAFKIILTPKEDTNIWFGAILSCEFTTGKTKQTFFRNLKKPQEVIIHYESEKECFLPSYVQFTRVESGQSLIKEIRHGTISADYLDILKAVATL
jgi:glucose-6-phosphate dehydrogenase assembly protein OpcA